VSGSKLLGVHHVTAFAKDPVANVRFYTRALGLRFIKKTVNFDAPHVYHTYFGVGPGDAGTVLTHFPDPRTAPGKPGTPEIFETVLAVPEATIDETLRRVEDLGGTRSDGESRHRFADHDGMRFELVPSADHAFLIAGTRLRVPDADRTRGFLRGVLGFTDVAGGVDGPRLAVNGGRGWVEVIEDPSAAATRMGAGTVHHVAWRVADGAAQGAVQEALREARVGVTPVIDRHYFRSIYFRVPGGVIFEVATDGPGFTVDESAEELGRTLQLPPEHEHLRASLERTLVPISAD